MHQSSCMAACIPSMEATAILREEQIVKNILGQINEQGVGRRLGEGSSPKRDGGSGVTLQADGTNPYGARQQTARLRKERIVWAED
jgi:hypothetical protein